MHYSPHLLYSPATWRHLEERQGTFGDFFPSSFPSLSCPPSCTQELSVVSLLLSNGSWVGGPCPAPRIPKVAHANFYHYLIRSIKRANSLSRTMSEKRPTKRHVVMKFQTTMDKESLKSFQKEKKNNRHWTSQYTMLKYTNTSNTQTFYSSGRVWGCIIIDTEETNQWKNETTINSRKNKCTGKDIESYIIRLS